eukprot:COSAG06_NODE_8835_length_2058_cov_1.270036_2_plen_97_part_01
MILSELRWNIDHYLVRFRTTTSGQYNLTVSLAHDCERECDTKPSRVGGRPFPLTVYPADINPSNTWTSLQNRSRLYANCDAEPDCAKVRARGGATAD